MIVSPSTLAKAWSPLVSEIESNNNDNAKNDKLMHEAIEHTIPLLYDGDASVPFVCRYRMDIIHPMTTKQVHYLRSLITRHESLEGIRNKLQSHLQNGKDRKELMERVVTSTSKTELEDLYAPFKPEPKGSIVQRIKDKHPQLVHTVEQLWHCLGDTDNASSTVIELNRLYPRDALISLLSTKLAAEPNIMLFVMEKMKLYCRIQTSVIKDPKKKYVQYHDFQPKNTLHCLKDHCVLAIRRGVEQKAIRMKYIINGTMMENNMQNFIFQHHHRSSSNRSVFIPDELLQNKTLLREVIHDAWTRLLRRRGTNRLWSEKCKLAQERAYFLFQSNLRRALLAPPYPGSDILLSLDPGFKAGIKCAILNKNRCPEVHTLKTIQYIGHSSMRSIALKELGSLIQVTQQLMSKENKGVTDTNNSTKVLVALGNGHGTHETRALIEEAAKIVKVRINVQVVSESGASVWSVTDAAQKEFPNKEPAAIASISIGRRLQNPLYELVKVPPLSLGLGMYQHDLAEKELNERLHLTSVDAVSTVGVDLNSCSMEILCKVPGLSSKSLVEKIIKSRPIKTRHDLINKISGVGPKTFENCAAFCRVIGSEPLDSTLVHPESYDVARWLMKHIPLNWKSLANECIPHRDEWQDFWKLELQQCTQEFGINSCRAVAILSNLIDSLLNIDPRLSELERNSILENSGSISGCYKLSSNMLDPNALSARVPIRGVIGVIRNITDFGIFVDFGYSNDGLIHSSKLGAKKLENFLIGHQLGIDILNVDGNRIALSLNGLDSEPTPLNGALRGTKNGKIVESSRENPKGRQRRVTEKISSKKRRRFS